MLRTWPTTTFVSSSLNPDPLAFACWFLGTPIPSVTILKTEAIEPIRADAVVFIRVDNAMFQTRYDTLLPLRMLDYFVRLYRKYRLPIVQGVVLLCEPSPDTVIESAFELGETVHRYRLVKLWEESPVAFLQEPMLLPLATLTCTENPEQLLAQVVQAVATVEDRAQRFNILACGKVLGGIRFGEQVLDLWLREDTVQESVIYQRLMREGEAKGKLEGKQEDKLEGKLEAVPALRAVALLKRRLWRFWV